MKKKLNLNNKIPFKDYKGFSTYKYVKRNETTRQYEKIISQLLFIHERNIIDMI